MSITLHMVIEQDEDGWFVVECPALHGCVSQGKTREEALDNIKDAIAEWLAVADEKALAKRKHESANSLVVAIVI